MYIYNIVLTIGGKDGQDPVLRRRSLESVSILSRLNIYTLIECSMQIEVFAQELEALFPDAAEIRLLAELVRPPAGPSGSRGDGGDPVYAAAKSATSVYPPTAASLERALTLCVSNPAIVHSPCLSHLLWDREDEECEVEGDQIGLEAGGRSAMDFVLAPAELASQYVPCRQMFSYDAYLQRGQTLMWRFSVGGGYDIEFGILYRKLGDGVDRENDPASFSLAESVSRFSLF